MVMPINKKTSNTKVLAVASAGGHWDQLMLLREAFAGCHVQFATTQPGLFERARIDCGYTILDCNRNDIRASLTCVCQCIWLMLKIRPDVVISTGAAPGLICLLLGRAMLAKTIWIDSVANAERLSLSGRICSYFVHVCLTQWRHLAKPKGPHYAGAVL